MKAVDVNNSEVVHQCFCKYQFRRSSLDEAYTLTQSVFNIYSSRRGFYAQSIHEEQFDLWLLLINVFHPLCCVQGPL